MNEPKEFLPSDKLQEINIVCNPVIAQEKFAGRQNREEIHEEVKATFGYILYTMLSMLSLVVMILLIFRGLEFFGVWILILLLPILMFLVVFARLYSNNIRGVPSNLVLDSEGIKYEWNYEVSRQSEKLLWQDLVFANARTVESQSKKFKDGEFIDLKYDLRHVGFRSRMALKFQTIGLEKASAFAAPRKAIAENHIISLSIPLDLFTLESDRMRFVSAISQWSPDVVLSEEFKLFADNGSSPTYTQLWLDDMQSFKRKRLRALPDGAILQDGRYEIKSRLAAGGQAQIYIAFDNEESRDVVLKEFVLPVGAGSDVRGRSFNNVKKEALILAGLKHDGIVDLFDNFVEDHRAYLVLEFVDGVSLRALVKKGGAVSKADLLQYALQMCTILDYLHSQEPPLVHRDFTPDNLVITSEGKIKLLDFNVAHLMESDTTKTVVGKHSYMSPEQFRGKPSPQSDLYSLGGTLYYLATGEDPVPLSQSKIDSDEDDDRFFSELIAKLTAMKVDERYDSARSVFKDLKKNIGSAGEATRYFELVDKNLKKVASESDEPVEATNADEEI